ncbi:DUF2145 domain-containing protein [Affinibrenneria salicis]|nr:MULTISPECIES: DUF2145 domain-containing protein [unclassified Brenneria]KAA8994708.1 DUF2145 domain-containing protein [Affinibrenneria salicis]NPD01883.1 DUF2145 domain-containing protein [Brenneria sp. hezel4-2-4]
MLATGCAKRPVTSSPQTSVGSDFCDRTQQFSAVQQDRLLRFAAVVNEELAATDGDTVLISRSGLDLSRFNIRYSHAAVALRGEDGRWTARQLYYACDEGRPRIYDQGLAGFVMGTENASLGYISIIKIPPVAARKLRSAALDKRLALRLLAANYSANAYAFGLDYQNCNQWVMELLAVAWGNLADGADLRGRAQDWLRKAPYTPDPIEIPSRWMMLASTFVPLVHLDDHPKEDREAMRLKISLPQTVETFIQEKIPGSERLEVCLDGQQVVVSHGWSPIAAECQPGAGDRVVALVD